MLLRWRHIAIIGTAVVVFFIYSFASFARSDASGYAGFKPLPDQSSARKLSSLFLTEKQCAIAFPGYDHQLDLAEARGPFDLRGQDDGRGIVQGRIEDGKVRLRTPRGPPPACPLHSGC
jgi:hypothetical protein